ncbi:tetratricopeptide repeat protein [Anabaena azotica]|uniref:O-linked N-acetylglucosamine transferase, SPINDLY family protein n=1 Tax=Anabaena azotica TaxID=197653 RepID=UPI0039A594AE
MNSNTCEKQAKEYLILGNYSDAAKLYEQAIEREPETRSNYWLLGLILLLQGQETEAQMTWFMALEETEETELYTAELVEVLQNEAERRITIEDEDVAWAIRQHIREIAPENIDNLLHLIQLSIKLDFFAKDDDLLLAVIDLLPKSESAYNLDLLLETLPLVLPYAVDKDIIFDFLRTCLANFPNKTKIVNILMIESIKFSAFRKRPDLAASFAELCLEILPDYQELLIHISLFYQNSEQYSKGIASAKRCFQVAERTFEKVYANSLITRGLMTAGSYWEESCASIKDQEYISYQLIEENPTNLDRLRSSRLFLSTYFFPYFHDNPTKNRYIHNQLARIAHDNINASNPHLVERYAQNLLERKQKHKIQNNKQKVLNIGYLSHCFKKHSVGWLCRWLFQHHNPDKFRIHTYSLYNTDQIEPFAKRYFADPVYKFQQISLTETEKCWEQIQSDEIDILVDLDSITLDYACELMSVKSASIQVTWLGWDAIGLPSIDYFIADPYVLPESAQEYYQETIWRLPQTYIAVDGFEVDVPNLRRDQLDIPDNAVVYLMTQKGYKRHLDHLRLQMKIIKEVPNSYLLVKGEADPESTLDFFKRIAEEEGIDFSQLRFLPAAPSEAIHRAILGLADVVLDTFPYNGATTTLETLWREIPLVTKVGQQFAARNSYGMMVNAGITEGIAWTDEEYVEWGVRLGKDENLRKEVSWKLRQGKKNAPLWNAEKFTREMEKAYQQMWEKYLDSQE